MEKRDISQKQYDYGEFFIIVVSLFIIGSATKNIAFGAVGLVMFFLGLDRSIDDRPQKEM